jgi:hypothetical protein
MRSVANFPRFESESLARRLRMEGTQQSAGLDVERIGASLRTRPIFKEIDMTIYAAPGTSGAKLAFKAKYDNFIGGKFVAPVEGQYFDVITPITGKPYTKAARSTAADIELALDAAHAATAKWAATPTASTPTSSCWPMPRRWTTARPSARR